MRVWLIIIALVTGLGVGVAISSALNDPAPRVEPEEVAPVPQSCLDAISAARDRLLLNPDVMETLRDYQALAQEIGDDVSDLRVPNLRESLAEFNDLSERSDALIQRSVNARFTVEANECERMAAERGDSA